MPTLKSAVMLTDSVSSASLVEFHRAPPIEPE